MRESPTLKPVPKKAIVWQKSDCFPKKNRERQKTSLVELAAGATTEHFGACFDRLAARMILPAKNLTEFGCRLFTSVGQNGRNGMRVAPTAFCWLVKEKNGVSCR